MQERYFESIIGAIVLVIASLAVLMSTQYMNGNGRNKAAYYLQAEFGNIEGITVGSEIKVSGVTVGNVSNLKLDTNKYAAVLTLKITQPGLELPRDTSIRVSTSGLIGSKYLDLQPGSDEQLLKNQDHIRYTQSSMNIEDLVGKFVTK